MIKKPKNKNEIISNYAELVTFIKKCGDVYQPHEAELDNLKQTEEGTGGYFNKLIELYYIYQPAMGSYGEGLGPERINKVSSELKKFSFKDLEEMFEDKVEEFRNNILDLLFRAGFTKKEIEKRDEERVRKLREKLLIRKRVKDKEEKSGFAH